MSEKRSQTKNFSSFIGGICKFTHTVATRDPHMLQNENGKNWNSITFGDAHRLDQRDILMSEITQL
jgi:hypothetical protein